MREYIRHNAGIPVVIINDNKEFQFHLLNVSLGGLACKGEQKFEINTSVSIRIPNLASEYSAQGRIAWCKKVEDLFEIGIEHTGEKDKARLLMVEQISHIEHYRNETMLSEGRELSGEEAAKEWLVKYGEEYR